MESATTVGRKNSMGATPRKNKVPRAPRALGARLADRLAECREAAITTFLESDPIFSNLRGERACRQILRWAAVQGSHLGLQEIGFNPYAVCREEGFRRSLAESGRIDLSARYVANLLAKISEFSSSIRVGVPADCGRRIAATYILPVLGPTLADLQAQARCAKFKAVEAHMEDVDYLAFTNRSAADFLHLPPPSEEVQKNQSTNPPKQYSRHMGCGRARGARAVPAGAGRALPEGFEDLLPLLLADLEAAFPGQPRERDLRTALLDAVIPAGETRQVLGLAIREAAAKGKALGYAIGSLRNREMADRLLRQEARRVEAEAKAQAKATQQPAGVAEASPEGKGSAAAAAPVLDAEGERLRDLIAATTLPQAHGEPAPVPLHRSSAARMAAALRAHGLGVAGGWAYFESVVAEFSKEKIGPKCVEWRCVNPAGFAQKGGSRLANARRAQARADALGYQYATGWDAARDLIRLDPQAQMFYAAWGAALAAVPSPDAPGWQDAWDRVAEARRALLSTAEAHLPVAEVEVLRAELNAHLDEAGLAPDSLVRRRAEDHHWGRMILAACGLEVPVAVPAWPPSPSKPAAAPRLNEVEDEDILWFDRGSEAVSDADTEDDRTMEEPLPVPAEPEASEEAANPIAKPAPEPMVRDAWSAEAVREGEVAYDRILAVLAEDPRSTAARNLRANAGQVLAYLPGRKLVLAWTAASRDAQRILLPHARRGAKALGLADLIIEFRGQRAA